MSASENVPNIVLNAYMECPVCLDFAASPIHTCKNGHIVCGICEEKTKICPTCQAGNLLVNDFVERVLKAEGVVVQCRNSQHGCTLLVPPSEMKTHLAQLCDFRPIKCNEGGELCDGKSYHPKELIKHWVDHHKAFQEKVVLPSNTNSSKGLLGTATIRWECTEKGFQRHCRSDSIPVCWKIGYVEIDGRTFILHCASEWGTFKAWVALLGMESVATKYLFAATINSPQNMPEKRIIFPMLPIHSLQYSGTKKIDDLGHTVAIGFKCLKSIQDEKPSDPKNALEWTVQFEIFSIEDPTNDKHE